ncbi:hypothetical protein LCGC14_0540080 [marine sediment metagenome]|uniref:Uncharacterized protein n=1 Tax=marine sediment metagenome TaxID=412755 RepID=A0A0F9UEE3_9ZZZZ
MLIRRCLKCGSLILKKKGIDSYCLPKCKKEFEDKFIKKGKRTYGYIYKITDLNDKKRILKSTKKNNWITILWNSMNKNRIDNLKIKILDSAKDEEELNEKEKYWKEFYQI